MGLITIGAKNFLAGESNWDYIADHGFSPDSISLNLFLKPGVLNFGWTTTDRGSTTLTGNIVASAYDKNPTSPNDTYHVDDEGNFYTLKGGTFTKRQTVVVDSFVLGTTDLIQFKLNTYATTQTRICQLTGSDLASVDSSWWTGLTTGYRHPMEVVEDKLYIADVNVIYFYDGISSGTAVTLPTDCNITSLRKHPDGRHLVAFTGYTQDYSHTTGGVGKIYIVNKDTLTWEREIQIDTQVEGSRLVGGIIYCTFGKQFGYFTGSGVKTIKQLKTSATTYSHCIGNMEDILLVRDGINVLAFGDLGTGTHSWHKFYQTTNGQNVNNIIYKGNGLVLVAFSDGVGAGILNELTYATPVGVTGIFISNRYAFDSIVKIRRIDIIHDQKSAAGIMQFYVSYRDSNDSINQLKVVAYPIGSTPFRTRVECDVTADIFQLYLQPSNAVLAIKQIRIYYDPII